MNIFGTKRAERKVPVRYITSGEYCGELPFKGERAILLNSERHHLMEDDNSPTILAQFDRLDLEHDGVRLAYHWHPFPRQDFTNLDIYDSSDWDK